MLFPFLSLFTVDKNQQQVAKVNGITTLINVLKKYSTNVDILDDTCRALINVGANGISGGQAMFIYSTCSVLVMTRQEPSPDCGGWRSGSHPRVPKVADSDSLARPVVHLDRSQCRCQWYYGLLGKRRSK